MEFAVNANGSSGGGKRKFDLMAFIRLLREMFEQQNEFFADLIRETSAEERRFIEDLIKPKTKEILYNLDAKTEKSNLEQNLLTTKLTLIEKQLEMILHRIADVHAAQSIILLPEYSGDTPWAFYRTKYEVVSKFNGWSEEERLVHLVISLTGKAAEVLTHIPPEEQLKVDRIIDVLSNKFPINEEEAKE